MVYSSFRKRNEYDNYNSNRIRNLQSFTDKVIPVVIIPYVVLLFIRDRADGEGSNGYLDSVLAVAVGRRWFFEGGGAGPAGRVSGRLCISRSALSKMSEGPVSGRSMKV